MLNRQLPHQQFWGDGIPRVCIAPPPAWGGKPTMLLILGAGKLTLLLLLVHTLSAYPSSLQVVAPTPDYIIDCLCYQHWFPTSVLCCVYGTNRPRYTSWKPITSRCGKFVLISNLFISNTSVYSVHCTRLFSHSRSASDEKRFKMKSFKLSKDV